MVAATPAVTVRNFAPGEAGFGAFMLSTEARSRSAKTNAPFESVPPSTTPNLPDPPYRAMTSLARWMSGLRTVATLLRHASLPDLPWRSLNARK